MVSPSPQQPSFPPPHTCHRCSSFVIYLPDDSNEPPHIEDKPISFSPNPSQIRLALQLYGDDFWTAPWTEYRNYFFERTHGISFLNAGKEELEQWSEDECLLSKRFLTCLAGDEEGNEGYAIGAMVMKSSAWTVELCKVDLENLRWELLLGGEEEEDPGNVYSILAEGGSTAAQIVDNHPINMQPDAVNALKNVKGWLEECSQNHENCIKPDPAFMPTRLVQISPKYCLREMREPKTEPYAALSYCWGGDQVFKTTTQMLPRYLEAIDPTQLPQTLQDAIYVAQQLGLQYIWIDALCIIQDSNADKAVEIGRMARVYGNATITIGATRASAVWNGFLKARRQLAAQSPDKVFSLPCKWKEEDMGTITLIPHTSEGMEPLDTRGWTFQERVLSPRVLDFGALRTQYTCQTPLNHVPSDGWSHLPLDRAYGSGLDARVIANLLTGAFPPDEMLTHWMAIVEGFTSRGLTFATDKLPAIAGMAEHFGALMKDEYNAGLWRRGMPASLLWTAGSRIQHVMHNNFEPRLSGADIAAPSWSWAAVSRAVSFDRSYTLPRKDVTFDVGIEDCTVDLADSRAPYGAVSSGALVLTACARKATWNIYLDSKILLSAPDAPNIEEFLRSLHGSGSTGITFIPDALEKEFVDEPRFVMDVWLLLFGVAQPGRETGLRCSFFGLVVRRRGDAFSRVGVFHKTVSWEDFEAYMAWFRLGGRERFVIV
ncbi:hypothetical protein N0V90_007433 [Kalmusia sp. IMI 367209]|nr:hypothetical protein N0V90_007433 [Kalmusia sp. IMI 367209]